MKYRIKHIHNVGYIPQVKENWLTPWRRIAKHIHGYGLYADCRYFLDSKEEAEAMCMNYDKWNFAGKEISTYKVEI